MAATAEMRSRALIRIGESLRTHIVRIDHPAGHLNGS
jgi:hypothetical protein